ncbi:MAG: pyruvate kinase alpha/beta domain-containing protein [Nitrososphaeria archaeon]
MEEKIIYFESGGRHNTEDTLKLAKERAEKRGIKNIILASISGYSAEKALEIFKDTNVMFTVVGLKGPNFPTFPENLKLKLEELGHNLVFAQDVDYVFPDDVKKTLWRFGEGIKVCVEIVLIATDAGYIRQGEEVIAVAGTGRLGYERGGGVDTAIVMEAIKSREFLQLETIYGLKEKRRKIHEIICKPR